MMCLVNSVPLGNLGEKFIGADAKKFIILLTEERRAKNEIEDKRWVAVNRRQHDMDQGVNKLSVFSSFGWKMHLLPAQWWELNIIINVKWLVCSRQLINISNIKVSNFR